jgi:hypothetical protein
MLHTITSLGNLLHKFTILFEVKYFLQSKWYPVLNIFML